MITNYEDNDYPTLPFKVRASGYSYTNSNDFTFTEFNGAPGRARPSFLNGWKSAQLQILLKDEYEQQAWQFFYDMDYKGTTGGIQKGVMPCFIECELGGQFGKFLCLITNPEFKKSSYQGKTAVLTLNVQVRPEIIGDDGACKKEVFEAFIACGVPASDFKAYLNGFNRLTEIDMNPINYYSRLVFKPNGINQYITIPQVDLVAGDTITFKFVAESNFSHWQSIIGSGTVGIIEVADSNKTIAWYGGGTVKLDGVPATHFVTPFPTDGLEHTLEWTCGTTPRTIDEFGAKNDGINPIDFPIYDVEITAASGNRFYPIDKVGWTSSNQKIANSLDPSGTTDGTSVNFDEEGWIEIEIKQESSLENN